MTLKVRLSSPISSRPETGTRCDKSPLPRLCAAAVSLLTDLSARRDISATSTRPRAPAPIPEMSSDRLMVSENRAREGSWNLIDQRLSGTGGLAGALRSVKPGLKP